jgi:hypothetical protein
MAELAVWLVSDMSDEGSLAALVWREIRVQIPLTCFNICFVQLVAWMHMITYKQIKLCFIFYYTYTIEQYEYCPLQWSNAEVGKYNITPNAHNYWPGIIVRG